MPCICVLGRMRFTDASNPVHLQQRRVFHVVHSSDVQPANRAHGAVPNPDLMDVPVFPLSRLRSVHRVSEFWLGEGGPDDDKTKLATMKMTVRLTCGVLGR